MRKTWKSRLVFGLFTVFIVAASVRCVDTASDGKSGEGGGTDGGGANGSGSGAPVTEAKAIVVTPTTVSLPMGTSQQLIATATMADGTTRDATKDVAWSSANPTVVAVDDAAAKGKVATVAPGTAAVVAKLGALQAACAVTVTDTAKLASIEVQPLAASIPAGGTEPFQAVGIYSDGTRHELAADVAWASSDETIATIDATGLVTGVAGGTASISATFESVTGASDIAIVAGILRTAPESGATNVAVTTKIDVVFSDELDPATVTADRLTVAFLPLGSQAPTPDPLPGPAPGPALVADAPIGLDGDVSYDPATRTVTFTPLGDRLPGFSTIYVTVGPGLSTTAGLDVAGRDPYTFTTVKAIETVFITLLSDDRPDYTGKPGETVRLGLIGIDSDGASVELTDQAIWTSSNDEVATVSNLTDPRGALTLKTQGVIDVSASFETFTRTQQFVVDGTLPIPGGNAPTPSSAITVSSTTAKSTSFRFTMGSDDTTLAENVRYGVYVSKTRVLATPADTVESDVEYKENAVLVYKDGQTEILGGMDGLEPSTFYHLNVLMLDDAGNEALYTEVTFTTSATEDVTVPVVADATLVVSEINTTDNSFKLTWGAAHDDLSADADIFYLVYYSSANDIDTVDRAGQNGYTMLFTYDQLSETFDDLPSAGSELYVNVVAFDVQGNGTAYATVKVGPEMSRSNVTGPN